MGIERIHLYSRKSEGKTNEKRGTYRKVNHRVGRERRVTRGKG